MATLKISDLSVGDWVQDNYGNYVKVAGIWQGCNFNYQVDILRDGRIGTIAPCNIHPIPITAEILEGNGFICKDFEKLRRWECGDVAVVRDKYEDALWCVCENTDKFCFDIDVRYIHQLQHALRLAGVDKEINL